MSDSILTKLCNKTVTAKTAIKLQDYLIKLVKSDGKLPEGDSKEGVDITALTETAGIDRQNLYPKRGAAETIELYLWAVKYIGIETILEAEKRVLNSSTPDVKVLQNMLKHSEMKLSETEAKVLELKAHNANLVKQVHKLNIYIEQLQAGNEALSNGYVVEITPWISQ
ncbi:MULTISPECIES: hypothetical protein [unclassified Pseudoalteromonas]|uniref:hypothetical protein n=1 Tax=unclassified Pseudoalteromonas TaxID=194690 RepID=UPI000A79DD01|nr:MULTISPECIES: hypothetical protein [unclassified Pseudoalteromonas]